MAETIGVNVLQRATNVDISDQFDGYSAVRIFVGTNDDGEEVIYEAGNTNGRTLEIKNPFGSQEMAENILADIQGYQYQPLTADGALLDPAAEMGDGVTVNGVYTGIFERHTNFGRLMASNISAPTDQEIEHEFAVESPTDRQYTRFVQQTRSMLKITNLAITAEVEARTSADEAMQSTIQQQAGEINARVTKTGINASRTFAWSLDSDGFYIHNGEITDTVKRNKSALFTFTNSGLEIKGKITATSGTIGGFTIGTNSIYSNGMSSMTSTQTTGVHVGTDGIKLGQKFSVDTSGNVTASGITASNLSLKGTLTFYNANGTVAGTLSAANLREGAKQAYDNHSTWSTGAGYGYNYNKATQWGTSSYPSYFRTDSLRADTIYFGTATLGLSSKSFKDGDGNTVYINYVSHNSYG